MNRSKIGARIFLYMFITALVLCFCLFTATYIQITKLQKYSIECDSELAEMSSDTSSTALISQAEETVTALAESTAANNDLIFERISNEIDLVAASLTAVYKNPDKFQGSVPALPWETENGVLMGRGTIINGVESTEELVSELENTTVIEPVAAKIMEDDSLLRMVLVGTEDGVFYRYSDYNDFAEDYDPRTRGWYEAALENPDEIVWSDAYYEAYGNLVVTCSKTFRGADGEIAGVVCSDVTIESMLENIKTDNTSAGGYAFILDAHGKYLAHPDSEQEDFNSDPLVQTGSFMANTVGNMVSGYTGLDRVSTENGIYDIAYAPIESTGWSLGIMISRDVITESVNETTEVIYRELEATEADMKAAVNSLTIVFLIILIVCLTCVTLASYISSRRIQKPISALVNATKEMGEGNLDTRVDIKGDDEIAMLGTAFNGMAEDLQKYIDHLSVVMEEKHRIGAELNVATRIQADMLPSIFPPFPKREEFDLFASMNPAKEVGGDFYDFFMLNDRLLALVIADVSGKGVPAALFMVISKTLIKNQAQTETSVADILEHVNSQLCETNGQEMFVTTWLGIVDIYTGQMHCANAGHEYPIIKKGGGRFEVLKDKHGFVLGGFEMSKYKEYEIQMDVGDTLFLYTDGVAEAQNSALEMFGLERTVDALNQNPDATPQELLNQVQQAVDEFVGEAPQFDDLTMLCYKQVK